MTTQQPADAGRSPTMTSVGRDTIIYLPGRIVPAVMAFATTAILTKFVLSPSDFGRYYLTMRVVQFLTMAGVIWMTTVLLRFYPRFAPKEEGGAGGGLDTFDSVVALLRWSGVGGGLIVLGLIWAFGPESLFGSYRDLLGVAAFVFVGNGLMELGLASARAKKKPWAYSTAAMANALLCLPAGILMLRLSGMGVAGFLFGFGLVTAVVAITLMRREFAHRVPFSLSQPQKAFLRECLFYGLPVMVTLILNFFLGNTDRFLLKYLRNDAMAGAYGAACQLLEQPMNMVFQTLMVAVFPAVTALYETKGREETETMLRQLTRQFFLFCLPLCVMLSVLGRHVMFAFTGAEFRDSYLAAPWLVTAALMYGLSYYASFGLHLAKRTGVLLAATAVSIAVNLAVNRLAIGPYGYAGCGMARLVANAVLVALLAAASRRNLRWHVPWASLFRIGAASAAAGLAVFFVQRHLATNFAALVILGCLFGVVYGAVSLATGEVRLDEIRKLAYRRRPRGSRSG